MRGLGLVKDHLLLALAVVAATGVVVGLWLRRGVLKSDDRRRRVAASMILAGMIVAVFALLVGTPQTPAQYMLIGTGILMVLLGVVYILRI